MLPIRDENPTSRPAVATLILIAINVFVFFGPQPARTEEVSEAVAFDLQYAAIPCELTTGEPLSRAEIRATYVDGDPQACDRDGVDRSAPAFPGKQVYLAILFSMFLHGGVLHLAGNMLFLWIFGNNIEDHLGRGRFLAFYLAGGLVATVGHVMVGPDSTVPVIGASGAVAAAMGAYLVWFPEAPIRTLVFMVFPVDIRAKWMLGFWFLSQFFVAPDAGVAWMAHVAGFGFGLVVGVVVRASAAARRRIWGRSQAGALPYGWDSTGGIGDGPYSRRWPYIDDDPPQFGRRRW